MSEVRYTEMMLVFFVVVSGDQQGVEEALGCIVQQLPVSRRSLVELHEGACGTGISSLTTWCCR